MTNDPISKCSKHSETSSLSVANMPCIWTNPFKEAYAQHISDGSRSYDRELIEDFGYTFLLDDAIDCILDRVGSYGNRIVATFSGMGYCERQLFEAGCDVTAYDVEVPERRWYENINKGNHLRVVEHPHCALFFSYTDRYTEAAQAITEFARAGGNLVIANATWLPSTKHTWGIEGTELFNRVSACKLLDEIDGPCWKIPGGMMSRVDEFHAQHIPTSVKIFDCSGLRKSSA